MYKRQLFKILISLAMLTIFLPFGARANSDVIQFATEASYPPFESLNSEKHFVGFDIDLAKALCEQMKAHCVFTDQPFDSLLASIEFGRYDAAISAIDITPKREKRVAFSQPYLLNGAVFVVPDGQYHSYSQLFSKVIAVQNGTSEQQYLLDRYVRHGAVVVPYTSYQMALNDLVKNKVDSVFVDEAVAALWLKTHPHYAMLEPITNKDYFGAGLAIAISKDNSHLKQRLNDALAIIRKNGTYKKIYRKYFADSPADVATGD
ncbi:transporter substrate-binding domain-containing protein [Celerinatantimonas sp. MCCC 1A17872]|uniref:transporter substrate-binding domain-containing protein n=1 Tax=Celerinatantimonas sp. MCCC 1A17872 TaxID=3177514 RepID=UPI0038CB38F1